MCERQENLNIRRPQHSKYQPDNKGPHKDRLKKYNPHPLALALKCGHKHRHITFQIQFQLKLSCSYHYYWCNSRSLIIPVIGIVPEIVSIDIARYKNSCSYRSRKVSYSFHHRFNFGRGAQRILHTKLWDLQSSKG